MPEPTRQEKIDRYVELDALETIIVGGRRLSFEPFITANDLDARHELTTADRRKGADCTNEIKRARRDEAEQEARHTLAEAAGEAVETLRAGLKAEDANTRIRSAVAILDRAWGGPRQAVEHAGRSRSRRSSSRPRSTLGRCSQISRSSV